MHIGISCSSKISAFSAILSSWSLIYNDEFDSNSSCLDRLNIFLHDKLTKTTKLATKCDQ